VLKAAVGLEGLDAREIKVNPVIAVWKGLPELGLILPEREISTALGYP
jgi:hypothetical protein